MSTTYSLIEFNAINDAKAKECLLLCCGSNDWANQLILSRPFSSLNSLYSKSENIWNHLPQSEWLSAFKHHPKIGDMDSLKKKFASTEKWAEKEQGSIKSASETVLRALSEGNAEYEKRHGFIFIVCATEKTAKEMLNLLQSRINNETSIEIKNAMIEQAKITRLRLEKLIYE